MRKREQFAVSLRKVKTKEIISQKRRRMLESRSETTHTSLDQTNPGYCGYGKFLGDNADYLNQLMAAIAPDFHKKGDIVSWHIFTARHRV